MDQSEQDHLNNERRERIDGLNTKLREGSQIHTLFSELTGLQKPILVDFNNVVANNGHPLEVNPGALEFIKELKGIGDIVFVTHAKGWDVVQQFLKQHSLWTDNMVLLSRNNWDYLASWDSRGDSESESAKIINAIISGFKEKTGRIDVPTRKFLRYAPNQKRLAPFFGKSIDVPLIDDSDEATDNNPGMHGIRVLSFEPDFHRNFDAMDEGDHMRGVSLKRAAAQVKEYYSNHEVAN